jgi:hypothetical protein
MALTIYTKTIVQDNVDRVVAAHHNSQETQLEAVTNHSLDLASLTVQGITFGTVGASTDIEKAVFVAPDGCTLAAMWLVNGASVSANAVNNTKLELVNKGSDGTGTTVVATFDGATTSFVIFDAFSTPITSTNLAKGDVLTLRKTDAGSGAAVTDLMVQVGYKPD